MYQELAFTPATSGIHFFFRTWRSLRLPLGSTFTLLLVHCFSSPALPPSLPSLPTSHLHSSSLGLFPSPLPFPPLHLLMLLKQNLWCSCHSLHHFPGLLLPPGGEPSTRVPWAAPTQGSPRAHAPHLVQRGFTSLCVSLHHC